ncbi:hypothetical protein [Tahibacter amnicola]|uniref:Uncharacterized protein n=1 Tax=Tahibacter amnicola TaxID=2976241 RepID=A0ABY6BHL5_9GAMM|nr:hypothetical protein [Tahibacter amnicola]UXI68570.1 hypothetical protein N4264_02635 [Tahibacter amnicola]
MRVQWLFLALVTALLLSACGSSSTRPSADAPPEMEAASSGG